MEQTTSGKRVRIQGLIWLILFLFATLPYLILVSQFSVNFDFDYQEFYWVLKRSFFQSFASASLTLCLAFFLSFGLRAYSVSISDRFINFSCLVPFFMPPLFIVLSMMAWIRPFPMGVWSVIAAHVFLSVGYCSLQLARIRGSRLGSMAETCVTMGVSRGSFQKNIFLPLVQRDLSLLWLLIFFQSFSSFAIPLLLGGGQAASLEVLIYELIRIQGNWGAAIVISLAQGAIVMALGSLISKSFSIETDRRGFSQDPYLVRSVGYLFPTVLFLMALGLFKESSIFVHFDFLKSGQIWNQIASSLSVAFGTSLGVYFFLLLLSFVWQEGLKADFFLRYSGPTPALTGFSILIFFPTMTFGFYFQSILALILISFPFFMKSDFAPLLRSLESQKQLAQVLGAHKLKTFVYVVWPQLHSAILRISALVGIWAMGDFSVSRLLATRDHTLALEIESLASHYRLDQAISLSFVLLFFMVVFYFLWKALGYVVGQTIKEKLWSVFN
jgi:thiamine transport system permease protein